MLTIKKVLDNATCILCDKQKECASTQIDGQGPGDVALCWGCVRKMAQMRMRMNGTHVGTPPIPTVAIATPARPAVAAK